MKKTFLVLSVFIATFLLSGCSFGGLSLPTKNTMANATLIRSDDAGKSWNLKMKIDDKKNIAGVDVLSMTADPKNSNIVYIGTASNGLFVSKDGAETWKQVSFANKAYGLVFDPKNSDIMYGSGVFNGRAKIFKRIQEESEWKEVYTEPADGTIISSLAIDRFNSQVLYAGTSDGVIIKTADGGQTWVNLKKADNQAVGPIVDIGFDAGSDSHVFFAVFQAGVLETKDGGATIEDITSKIDTEGHASSVYSLVADPSLAGVVYVGTGAGIFKRSSGGNWDAMNIIESSKAFAVRSIAVNPKNSNEIMYSASKAIYKSTNSGATWATFQLDTSKEISVLRYDQADPSRIFAGLRSF